MFRKMPFLLLSLMAMIGVLHPWIPEGVQSILYAVSLSVKSLILFVLPVIIFGLLYKTTAKFAKDASKLVLILLAGICCSNFLSTMLSYSVGNLAYTFDLRVSFPNPAEELQPAWNASLPQWISNDWAMLAGVFLGLMLGRFKPLWTGLLSKMIDPVVGFILKGLLFAIPLFITGFVLKMYHDQMMVYIWQNYGVVFGLTACSLFVYIFLLYALASRGGGATFIQTFKNMLPAAMAGFGSMSSAAAMPLTLLGVEKNARNPELARSIVPATVNVHLIGDCFAIPIFAFAVLKSFGVAAPDFMSYLIFAGYFVLAKFSVAAVPGGGILVMLPILEKYLGFSPVMLSLITALYILFDPIITSANILGNGSFAMGLSRLSERALSKIPTRGA